MTRYVLGAVVSDHDSSVCLLADGKMVGCVSEERLCRVRHGDPRNSIRRAMSAVLAEAGIELSEVAAIFCDTDHFFPPGEEPVEVFPDYPLKERIYQITHHLGHAASAFLPSPFDEAAFLTVDASGGIAPVVGDGDVKRYWTFTPRELSFMEQGFQAAHAHSPLGELLERLPGGEARNYPAESLTVGYAKRGGKIVELADHFADGSLGYLYALCSHFLDMEEGSFMGLASHGHPTELCDAMKEVIVLEPEGRVRIDDRWMRYWQDEYVLDDPVAIKRLTDHFLKSFGPGRKFFGAITQKHMDFAFAVQQRLEEALVHVTAHLYNMTKMDNLVMAGGVALNSVANGVVLAKTPFSNIFVQPAASDDGLALGFAQFGDYVLAGLPKAKSFTMGSACTGPDRDGEIDAFVESLRQGTLPVEYVDSLPYVERVDVLWKGPNDTEYERTAMLRTGPHKHVAHLPIGPRGGIEYKFEIFARHPEDYEKPAAAAPVAKNGRAAIAEVEQPEYVDPNRPTDPFEMFLYDHRDVAGVLDGERAFVGPEQVTIDPTNLCDNNCLACWTKSPLLSRFAPPQEWHRQTLPEDLMHGLIDDLADLGTQRVRFTGGGDPFVHPKMIEFLEHVKERGMIACVTTNFTSITQKKVHRMAEIGVDEITASVWAGTPDMYARSHPAKTQKSFWQIESFLRELCAAKKPHMQVVVANVLFSMNYMETREMLDFALRVGADGVYYTVVDSVAKPTDGLLLTPPHLSVLRSHLDEVKQRVDDENQTRPRPFILDNFDGLIRRLDAVGATRGDYDRQTVDAIPCYIGWIFARITADGKVAPCCRGSNMPLGDLHEQSFKEIWHGHLYRHFRKMALNEKKSHPFFKPIQCHRTCDNLMHNENHHRKMMRITAEEKRHLIDFVVNGGSR
ncbi:MAG: radical SAM protein [Deltaproteobacteria bacterium]|nr:radical SAM protein [Deltaproteobacteria bacterium]